MTYLARTSAVEIEDLDLSGSNIESEPTLSETTPPSASVLERIPDRVERVTGYDYGAIDSQVAEEAELIAARVRERMRANIIETGTDLLAIKAKLPHGGFLPWIQFHFGWGERTAQNLMNAAKAFGSTPRILAKLPESTIYKLAAKSTPEEIRRSVIDEIDRGGSPDPKGIAERIAQAKPSLRRRLDHVATAGIASTSILESVNGTPAPGEDVHTTVVSTELREKSSQISSALIVELLAKKVAHTLKTKLSDRFEESRDLLFRTDFAAFRKALSEV